MENFGHIVASFDQRNQKILLNIADFDADKTPAHIEKCREARRDILLLMNALKLVN